MAEPLRRLGARLLDYAIFLPVTLTATIVAVLVAAPHFGPLGAGAAVAREGLYGVCLGVGMIGLIDPLWCLWDGDRQCLHDKEVSMIVVQD